MIKSKVGESSSSASSTLNLKDIPKESSLYEQIQAYLQTKEQSHTFASIAKETDPVSNPEETDKKEIIFLLENSDIQRKNEPWNILQRYLTKGLYFPGETYKSRTYYESILSNTKSAEFQHFSDFDNTIYNFSKITFKQIISAEDWGISTLQEKQVMVNGVNMSFTYWDYIQAFNKVFYYNNYKQKHTWFVKICAKVFSKDLPNWFLNWWSFHGPTVKILPDNFFILYKEWAKVSPFITNLFLQDHVSCIDKIDQMYFFIKFSIPWIHKWTPEMGYTPGENIPCLYRKYFTNFWDKLNRKYPATGKLYGQELLDQISNTIKIYQEIPQKDISAEGSVKHIARRISIQEGNKEELINKYLAEIKRNLLTDIAEFDKSDTSMRSGQSDTADEQSVDQNCELSEGQLQQVEEFLASMKEQEHTIKKNLKGKDKI